jgi:acyl-CoA thioesterase FadM
VNLLFRLFYLLVASRFKPAQDFMDTATIRLRAWPTDLDINLHLTNSRYLAMMDLGRIELLSRSGMLKQILKRRWLPVVSMANVRYRRQINPFQRFTLHTRLLGWDEKWFYLEQRFETDAGIVAVGIVKGLFRGPEGNVPTAALLELVGHKGESCNKSDYLLALDEFEHLSKSRG